MGKYKELIKNVFFPKSCLGCGKLGIYTCHSCIKSHVPIKNDICVYCKNRSYFGLTHPGCKRVFGVDGLKSIYIYSPMMMKIIKGAKYRLAIEILQDFLSSMPSSIAEDLMFYNKLNKEATIIPVPLYKNKLKQRGFNQALIIAQFLQKILTNNVDSEAVKRIKNTKPQSSCRNAKERLTNTSKSFSICREKERSIKKQAFIIVDDIWASGATAK